MRGAGGPNKLWRCYLSWAAGVVSELPLPQLVVTDVLGAVRPTVGKTLAVMQVSGGVAIAAESRRCGAGLGWFGAI